MNKKHKVICLCGSTKFKKEFLREQQRLALQGNVVLSIDIFSHVDSLPITDSTKILLDDLHRQKIDMADEIFVINKNDYIGVSTQKELDYALACGKPVSYMEEHHERNRSNI